MIRHIVLVKFPADLPQAEIDGVFGELAALEKVAPDMLSFAAGPNVSPEPLARGYGHAFVMDFTDAEARDAYLAHPAHVAAGARLASKTEGGIEGILVIDIEMT
jgi:hypothetical protein